MTFGELGNAVLDHKLKPKRALAMCLRSELNRGSAGPPRGEDHPDAQLDHPDAQHDGDQGFGGPKPTYMHTYSL